MSITGFGFVQEWRFHSLETDFPISMKHLIDVSYFDKTHDRVLPHNVPLNNGNAILWDSIGFKLGKQRPDSLTPAYAYSFDCFWDGQHKYATQWLLCYANNPGPKIIGTQKHIGSHPGDFENIILIYDNHSRDKLFGIFCLAHGMSDEATFIPHQSITKNYAGNPVVWVAMGSHAHIGEPRNRLRYLITKDEIDNVKPISWTPKKIIDLDKEWWINLFHHRWGHPTDGAWTPDLMKTQFQQEWTLAKQNGTCCIFGI